MSRKFCKPLPIAIPNRDPSVARIGRYQARRLFGSLRRRGDLRRRRWDQGDAPHGSQRQQADFRCGNFKARSNAWTHFPYTVIRLFPLKYNELYRRFKNLNRLLGWAHAAALADLSLKTGCKKALLDQFAEKHVMETALKQKKIEVELQQKVRGEEDLVVAAASILARGAFLDGMQSLSEEYGMEIPKGASAQVKRRPKRSSPNLEGSLSKKWLRPILKQRVNFEIVEDPKSHFNRTGRDRIGFGLNILTGETGSGKSAVLSAIQLIAGGRADASLIRQGSPFAIVEAALEDSTIIRREIYRSGKNRCFIDEAQVSLGALKGAVDIEMVDQNSSHAILEEEGSMLDAFAGIVGEVDEYKASVRQAREIGAELEKWLQVPKERELEWAEKDLAWIEEVDWKAGEEASLAEEHNVLIHAQDLAAKVSGVSFGLSEGPELPSLKRMQAGLESCIRFDPKLAPIAQSMKNALLELEETGQLIQNYADRLEADPGRLAAVEKRIGAIESLIRRFGADIEGQKEKLRARVQELTHLDAKIGSLRSEMEKIGEQNRQRAASILEQRRAAAPRLASQVLAELKSLNLPHAQFEIAIGKEIHEVQFLFSANPGLPPAPLEQCASGGELSRLLLAIKTILVSGSSTLVFDEIDSNVGGQTAAILGEKLKRLAEKRQVICVTHFVQVAKCATDHYLVKKSTRGDHAYTDVARLSQREKEVEYSRMLGDSV